MQSNTTNVVVIGGGYAGVMAANRLTQRDDVAVTLINPRPVFVHRIRLHQLLGGSNDAVVEYSEILADRVRLVVDTVTHISSAHRSVTLASSDTIDYDYLIYAVGSVGAVPTVPGRDEFAHQIASLEAAQRARSMLDNTPVTAPVTVVGAGATGIEVAAELAEEGRRVTLVSGTVLNPYLHPRVRRRVARRLAQLGVIVIEGAGARVTAVERNAVQLENGRALPSAVTLWTAGFALPDLAARSGLSTDADGRLLTDETLTSVDDGRIVAAGDSAAPSDLPLRMSMQAAIPWARTPRTPCSTASQAESLRPSTSGSSSNASAWVAGSRPCSWPRSRTLRTGSPSTDASPRRSRRHSFSSSSRNSHMRDVSLARTRGASRTASVSSRCWPVARRRVAARWRAAHA